MGILNSVDPKVEEAVLESARDGDTDALCSLLARHPACVHTFDAATRYTTLHFAAEGGHAAACAHLLARGAPVGAHALHRATPLHVAADAGRRAVVRVLVRDGGADVEARDADERTPVHGAACFGHVGVVRELWALGADVNAVDGEGWSPVHFGATTSGDCVRVLTALHECGANMSARNHCGWTAAHHCALLGRLPALQALHGFGVPMAALRGDGKDALDVAQQQGHVECVQWLQGVLGDDDEDCDEVDDDDDDQ